MPGLRAERMQRGNETIEEESGNDNNAREFGEEASRGGAPRHCRKRRPGQRQPLEGRVCMCVKARGRGKPGVGNGAPAPSVAAGGAQAKRNAPEMLVRYERREKERRALREGLGREWRW